MSSGNVIEKHTDKCSRFSNNTLSMAIENKDIRRKRYLSQGQALTTQHYIKKLTLSPLPATL
ncbi:hypothetical protein Hanom_Chr03g00210471 [Helianthus anomalus]